MGPREGLLRALRPEASFARSGGKTSKAGQGLAVQEAAETQEE
jgi:hypothetical protein